MMYTTYDEKYILLTLDVHGNYVFILNGEKQTTVPSDVMFFSLYNINGTINRVNRLNRGK